MRLFLISRNFYPIDKYSFNILDKINDKIESYFYTNNFDTFVYFNKLNFKNSKYEKGFKSKDKYLASKYFLNAIFNDECELILSFHNRTFSIYDYFNFIKTNIDKLNVFKSFKNSFQNIYTYGKNNICNSLKRYYFFNENVIEHILLSREVYRQFKKRQQQTQQMINSNIQKPKTLPKPSINCPTPEKRDQTSYKKPLPPTPSPKPTKSICKNKFN